MQLSTSIEIALFPEFIIVNKAEHYSTLFTGVVLSRVWEVALSCEVALPRDVALSQVLEVGSSVTDVSVTGALSRVWLCHGCRCGR